MIKLAIVEDNKETIDALKTYFEASDNFHSVQIANNVEEFIEQLDSGYYPDIVLQDIQLPGKSGIEAIQIYKEKIPDTKILMNSVLQNSETVFAAICAGALGYIEKGYSLEKIKEAIISLYQGGSPMSPGIARHVVNFFNPSKKFEEKLTSREQEIVQGIIDGLSYKLIADRLNISIDTVRTYITRIYRKLQINSKGELLARYMRT
jgi:DNA-binding NarL/FixJ family response regulator